MLSKMETIPVRRSGSAALEVIHECDCDKISGGKHVAGVKFEDITVNVGVQPAKGSP